MDFKPILNEILDQYPIPWKGYHGVAHWARALENGLKLSVETGADLRVVSLFAVLHDSQRNNEGHDPEHGPRAARFAETIHGRLFELPDEALRLLVRACEGHTQELTHPDITIQTCWDADRLDLGRVGITPHPSRLCTEQARRRKTIDWAHERALAALVPELVRVQWGIDRLT